MFKKIILFFIVFITFCLIAVFYMPISIFENNINDFLKKNLKSIDLSLKGIGFQLIDPSEIRLEEVNLRFNNYNCLFRDVDIKWNFWKIKNDLISIRKLKLDNIDCTQNQLGIKENKEKEDQSNNASSEIKILITNLSINKFSFKDLKRNLEFLDILAENIKYDEKINIKLFKASAPRLDLDNHQIKDFNINISIESDLLNINEFSFGQPLLNIQGKFNNIINNKITDNVFGSLRILEMDMGYFFKKTLGKYELTQGSLTGDLNFNDLDIKNISSSVLSADINTDLRIKDMIVSGINIDKVLTSYISSNENNWLDIAGFLTLGPVGLLVSKSSKISQSLPGINSGKTHVKEIIIKTQLYEQIIKLSDLAIKTNKHLVVVKGEINNAQKKMDLKIAPITNKGCPIFIQKVTGTFKNPDIGAMKTIAGNLFSPVTDIFQKSKNAVFDCKKFYNGALLIN